MSDNARLKKKVTLSLLSSPATLLPFAVGVSGLLINWAVSAQMNGQIVFASLILILSSFGIFATRLLNVSDKTVKKAITELEQEEHAARESQLDELSDKLMGDYDHRTDQLLSDLRALSSALQKRDWFKAVDSISAMDILANIRQLFEGCVAQLRYTLELYNLANQMSSSNRRTVMARREEIISEVGRSVKALAEIVGRAETFDTVLAPNTDLAALRQELDINLKTALEVQAATKARMNEITAGLRS